MISFAASASNMENDIEQARASNMEEDKASASDIEMAKDILKTLDTEVRLISFQPNGSESRRSECCIYRVPKPLRNVNSKAYDPNLISIGPLHRENKGLEAMEKEKLNYFRKLTEQYGMDEKKICDIVISIKNQEERIRNCYSEKSILMESSDDFVKMILLDAVFIILFFLESNDDDGPKILEPWMTFGIREDLMLLENQLPLFIIQEIYGRVSSHSQGAKAIPFLDLASCHFRKESFLKRVEIRPNTVEGSRHFTDLLRNLMLGGAIKHSDICKCTTMRTSDLLHILDFRFSEIVAPLFLLTRVLKYSAVMLLKAGVRFEASKDTCLVNITFDKGVLKIPRLEVDHNFERRIRNIMALEQCCYSSEAYICSYIKFMDHLIDSAEDVGLLVWKGIIVHTLGDDAAVSNMINNLCENIGDNINTRFVGISHRLNVHYENRSNHRKATLKLVYFPNIWRGTATVAAAILLILTFIQALLCKTSPDVEKETSPDVKNEPRHLSDLLRNLMLSRAIQRTYSPDLVQLKYSAIMLHKAGVRFQVTRDECLVNISLNKGVLKIPHLKVDHNFERRIRNIMALEQCLYEWEAYICSYIKFMAHLIDSAGDVGLLVENGIIENCLAGDAEVSEMIKNLWEDIGDNDTCFGDISKELNAHYDENPWNHRKATLKLVYFNTKATFPDIWRGTGTVAAAILLILTLMQTIKAFL